MTTPTSIYPRSVDELLPAARNLAVRLGHVPSRNGLMRELRIGSEKARQLHEALCLPTGQEDDMGTPPLWIEPASPTTVEASPATVVEPIGVHPAVITPQTSGHVAVDTAPVPMIPNRPTAPALKPARKPVTWPVLLLCLPAFVAVWSGWVELGELSGFGVVNLLPGIVADGGWATLNTAITLPIGVEVYGAYALWVWLSGRAPKSARRFARNSAIGSLVFGAAGQAAYHLMASVGMTAAPWWITTLVACLPVAVLGMGAALAHLQHAEDDAS